MIENINEDEKRQIKQIKEMATKIRTYKLKRGYRQIKHSKLRKDIIARTVIKEELEKRGVFIK